MAVKFKRIVSNQLMDLDFLEIGISNFDTLIQTCSENEIGMSVEPITHYLNALPNKPNVIKVNVAITSNKVSDTVDLYYIPEDVIDSVGLHPCLKGCNSIGNYHGLHWDSVKQYVRIDKVPLINIHELLIQYNIRKIQYLKIDTEGHDCVILKGLFEYLKTKTAEYYPKRILFESNEWTPSTVIDETIHIAKNQGYAVGSRDNDNTILILI